MSFLTDSLNWILAVAVWFGYGLLFTEFLKGRLGDNDQSDKANIILNFVATLIVCSLVFKGFVLEKALLVYGLQLVVFNVGKLTGLNDKVFTILVKKDATPPTQPK